MTSPVHFNSNQVCIQPTNPNAYRQHNDQNNKTPPLFLPAREQLVIPYPSSSPIHRQQLLYSQYKTGNTNSLALTIGQVSQPNACPQGKLAMHRPGCCAPVVSWFPAPNDASLLFRAGQV